MKEKPKLMWHADADGLCHKGCEQYTKPEGIEYPTCDLRRLITGGVLAPLGQPCPFAILSDVLCCGEEEADERWCRTCANWTVLTNANDVRRCEADSIRRYGSEGRNCKGWKPIVTTTEPSDDLVERCCQAGFKALHPGNARLHRPVYGLESEDRDFVRAVLKEAQKR